jgi:AraC-like DNA-binding protein
VAGTDYRERPAPPGLGLVCVWSQTVPRDGAPHVQRVVPDACVDLIWSDWTGLVHVAGPDTGPVLAGIPPGGRLTGVRFRPGLAGPALGVPVDAVRDARVPLRELWGDGAAALADALAGGADPAEALTRAVAARLRAAAPADPAASALLSAFTRPIAASAAEAAEPAVDAALPRAEPVRDIARRLGLSERQLRRRALAAFGYGPKTLQRVLRFQRALALARRGDPPSGVAYVTGYADQAHFAHDVRDLAGVPLTELLSPAAADAATPSRPGRRTA